ncbi:ABC transporter permease [Flavobacteriaceae bacterium]|nr:ABC transporter permease [Flavobacteriaceae bacterium]MDA9139583.1 ABC transporter permease [Flavobacteriaceae bacterium]
MKHYKSSVSARIIKIATLAVAMGMAMILIAVATGKGLQKEIKNKTAVFNGHLVVSPFENSESQVSIIPFLDSPELRANIESEAEVIHLQRVAIKAGLLKTDSSFEGVVFKGVDADYEWENLNTFLVEGRFPDLGEKVSNEVVVSKVIAQRLSLEIGDDVSAYFQNSLNQKLPNIRKFKIVGFFLSGFPDFDQTFVLGDIKHVQRINKWKENQIGAYEVFLKDLDEVSSVGSTIYKKLPSDLDVVELTKQYATIFQWISLFDFNILIIITVMIIVGVINMSTALLVLILERSQMIGLLKTLGARNKLIQKIFLFNGIVIMSRGLLWGNFIGLLFYFSQRYGKWIRLDPETYYVNVAPVSLGVLDFLVLNLGVLGISAVLLWIPSLIISGISPARVLRFR